MDATFSWRKTRASDLAECLQLHPAKNGAETVGQARAARAWQQLLEMSHATRSAVVEMHDKTRVEIVGFGFGSFVKKSFIEDEIRNPRPGLNSRIVESIVSLQFRYRILFRGPRRQYARRPAASNSRHQLEEWPLDRSPGRRGARLVRPRLSGAVCGVPLLQDSFRDGG